VPTLRWLDEGRLDVDGIAFVSSYRADSTSTSFYIRKEPESVRDLVALLDGFAGANIVELGIAGGGSAALMSLIASPKRLVAFELDERPVAGLEAFIAERGLGDVVHTHYGVDQSDRDRLAAIVAAEFGDEPIDLVVDDASHLLAPTRASFEVLFPLVRPGGLYLIEDWNWQEKLLSSVSGAEAIDRWSARFNAVLERDEAMQAAFETKIREALADDDAPNHDLLQRRLEQAVIGDAPDPATRDELFDVFDLSDAHRDEPSLITFVFELVMARAGAQGARALVDQVTLEPWWAMVRRGPGALDASTFRVEQLYDDVDGLLPQPDP
jgi:predicted O-methyltransferase YrrM